MSQKLTGLDIRNLALVKRGANRVNHSVLKSDKGIKGKIFKEETADEASAKAVFENLEDNKRSADILVEVADIMRDCKEERTVLMLTEMLEKYEAEIPEINLDDGIPTVDASTFDSTPTVTAAELLT